MRRNKTSNVGSPNVVIVRMSSSVNKCSLSPLAGSSEQVCGLFMKIYHIFLLFVYRKQVYLAYKYCKKANEYDHPHFHYQKVRNGKKDPTLHIRYFCYVSDNRCKRGKDRCSRCHINTIYLVFLGIYHFHAINYV